MYCSNTDGDDCTHMESIVSASKLSTQMPVQIARDYFSTTSFHVNNKHKSLLQLRTGVSINGTRKYGVEQLLFKYGVDLSIWAHEHCYERLWPVYNRTVSSRNDILRIHYSTFK